MGERHDARREVEQKRERMSRIAHEVSRRMTPGYAKERAREMARERMSRARDGAVESSWFMPLVGAGIGALVARTLQSRAHDRGWAERDRRWDEERRYGYPRRSYPAYQPYEEHDPYLATGVVETSVGEGGAATGEERGAGAGDRLSEAKERGRAKAEEMRDRASAKAGEVKERFREATSSMRERMPDRERMRDSAREDTGLWALGALALGALFGFALPETRREREMLEPARRKARELGEQAKQAAVEKGTEALDRANERLSSAGGGEEGRSEERPATTEPGTPPAPGPLH